MDRDDPPPFDCLSSLSDNLLHSIIALLNLHEQVRTSVLSRRWRDLWCTNPVLKFNVNPFRHPPIHSSPISDAIVGHCLQQCADVIQLSFLEFRCSGNSVVQEHWIDFAAARTVDSLVIWCSDLFFDIIGGNSDLPLSIYWCRSLKSLEIRHADLPDPSSLIDSTVSAFNFFPLLKSLYLRNVEGIGLYFLLSCCTELESLELWEFSYTKNNFLPTKLRRLIIEAFSSNGLLIIQKFKDLKSLQLYYDLTSVEISAETGEQLDTVTLFSSSPFQDFPKWLLFLRKFKNVKDLSVNRWFVKFMMEDGSRQKDCSDMEDCSDQEDCSVQENCSVQEDCPVQEDCSNQEDCSDQCPVFENLEVFHYCDVFYSRNEIFTLADNLSCFPSLEKLYFHCENYHIPIDRFNLSEDDTTGYTDDDEGPEDLQCVFTRLRNVIVTSFLGETRVMMFIEFVMNSSPILESIVIYYHKAMDINRMIAISTEIQSYNRVSSTLQLYFPNTTRSKCYAHDHLYVE